MRKPSFFDKKIEQLKEEIRTELVIELLALRSIYATEESAVDFPKDFDANHDFFTIVLANHFTDNPVTYGVTKLFFNNEDLTLCLEMVDLEHTDVVTTLNFDCLDVYQANALYNYAYGTIVAYKKEMEKK